MITKIQNPKQQERRNKTAFKKADESYLVKELSKSLAPAKLFIQSQESLSSTRVIQDTATNWLPKAVFTRSAADFGDMSFLEGVEDFIFYFSAPLLGQQVLRKIYPKFAPKELRNEINELIPKSADEILKNKTLRESAAGKRILPLKAGMVLACAAIPAAEYGLSFAKNLFTLKVFKKSDFNSIANLEQNEESTEHQQNLKKSAKDHLIKVGLVSAVGLAVGTLFATVGHKSNTIQNISEKILTPYEPVTKFIEKIKPLTDKKKSFIKNLVNLDFGTKPDEKNGGFKLTLGKGMLGLTAISGFFGYKRAAEDRGKLDVYEVCTRVPIVVLYTIFGSALFDHGFKKILHNKNKYPDLIKKDKNGEFDDVPSFKELPNLAEKIAKDRKTKPQIELNRLVKEKAVITAIPYGFGLVFMGFLLAGITRFWTQYRYNHGVGHDSNDKTSNITNKIDNSPSYGRINSKRTNYFSWMNNP